MMRLEGGKWCEALFYENDSDCSTLIDNDDKQWRKANTDKEVAHNCSKIKIL